VILLRLLLLMPGEAGTRPSKNQDASSTSLYSGRDPKSKDDN
jgi:hypothetical protein